MFGRRNRVSSISARALHGREVVRVLDVREDTEWRSGHIEGALHIPMGQLDQRLGELEPGPPIVVVCRSGQRSEHVTALLAERGYTVENLEGGLKAWARAGLPLVTSEGPHGKVV